MEFIRKSALCRVRIFLRTFAYNWVIIANRTSHFVFLNAYFLMSGGPVMWQSYICSSNRLSCSRELEFKTLLFTALQDVVHDNRIWASLRSYVHLWESLREVKVLSRLRILNNLFLYSIILTNLRVDLSSGHFTFTLISLSTGKRICIYLKEWNHVVELVRDPRSLGNPGLSRLHISGQRWLARRHLLRLIRLSLFKCFGCIQRIAIGEPSLFFWFMCSWYLDNLLPNLVCFPLRNICLLDLFVDISYVLVLYVQVVLHAKDHFFYESTFLNGLLLVVRPIWKTFDCIGEFLRYSLLSHSLSVLIGNTRLFD